MMPDKNSDHLPENTLPEEVPSGTENAELTDDITPLATTGGNSFNGVTNFSTYLQGGVDQRTGTYSAKILLGILQGNNLTAPGYEVSVSYSPLEATADSPFGKGWKVNDGVVQINKNKATLLLPAGDILSLNVNYTDIGPQPVTSVDFNCTSSDAGVSSTILSIKGAYRDNLIGGRTGAVTVTLRDGSTLIYGTLDAAAGSQGVIGSYFLSEIINENGQSTRFERDTKTTLLTSIEAYHGGRAQFDYQDGVTVVDISTANAAEKQNFRLNKNGNGELHLIENTSLGDYLKWNLSYQTVTDNTDKSLIKTIYGSGSVSLLSGITSPGGGTESVVWSAKAKFENLPEVSTTPHVTTCTRALKAGQASGAVTARYEYGRDIASAIIGEAFNPEGYYEAACVTEGDSTDNHVTVNYWKFNQDNMGAEQEAWDVILRGSDKDLGPFALLAKIADKEQYPALVGQKSVQFYPAPGGNPVLAKLATNTKTTYINRINGTDYPRTEEHTFKYDDQGNLTQEKRPDGSQVDYTYYPAAGETVNGVVNCPANPQKVIGNLKTLVHTPRQTSYSTPKTSTRYFYKAATLFAVNTVLLSRQEEWRDTVKLSQTTLKYNETGDFFGTLASSEETTYGSDGKAYVTTSAHAYSKNGRLLTVKNTVTTHDKLAVTSSVTKSIDSGLVYAKTDVRGNTVAYTYDKLGRMLTRVTNKGTAYAFTDTQSYGVVGVNGTGGLPDPAGSTKYTGWMLSTSTRQPGVKHLILTDSMGRLVATWLTDPKHDNGNWMLMQSVEKYTSGNRPAEMRAFDLIEGRQIKNITTLKYTYDSGMVTTSTDTNQVAAHSEERMVDSLSGTPGAVASTRTWTSGTLNGGQRSATAVEWKDMNGLVLRGELRDETDAVLSAVTYDYDGLNRLRKSTDELGRVTTFEYDARDRVSVTILPDGSRVTRDYAPFSAAALTTGIGVTPSGKAKIALGTQMFDGLGRNTQSVSGGRTYSWTFTGSSPVPATMTTPKKETLSYTTLPQLGDVMETVKDGATAGKNISNTYSYDGKTGLMSGDTDISGRKTTNVYNPQGVMTSQTITSADGKQTKTTSAGYSPAGRMLDKTDVTGAKTTYIYDGTGRLANIQDRDVRVTLTYDALGRVYQTTRHPADTAMLGMTTTLTFDARGREETRKVESMMLNRALKGYTMTSAWYDNGQLKSRAVTSQGGTSGDLRQEAYTYDTRNRLETYTCSGAQQPKDPAGNTIKKQALIWDALDNLTQCDTTFQDAVLPQLTGDRLVYTYDTTDRTQLRVMTHTNLVGDILHGEPLVTILDYDANGNLIRDEQGRTLKWNAVSQLTGMEGTTLIPPETRKVTLTQDATGTPASRKETLTPLIGATQTTTRDWYYGGDGLQAELNGDGSLSRMADSNTQMDVAKDGTRTTRLMSADGQQSPQLNAGTDEWHNWGPFGECPPPVGKELTGYTGEHRDPWTGNYYLGQRQYSPAMRHFTSPDSLSPFGAGGINAYAYCGGDPVNNTDPTGHFAQYDEYYDRMARKAYQEKLDARRAASNDPFVKSLPMALAIIGVLAGIVTFGAAAGVVLAGALTAAALLGAVAGVATVVGASLSIASIATAESNPELSRRLGFAASVFDIVSLIDLPLSIGNGIQKISRWISRKVATRGIGAARNANGLVRAGEAEIDGVKAVYYSNTPKDAQNYVAGSRGENAYSRSFNRNGAEIYSTAYQTEGSTAERFARDAMKRGQKVSVYSGIHGQPNGEFGPASSQLLAEDIARYAGTNISVINTPANTGVLAGHLQAAKKGETVILAFCHSSVNKYQTGANIQGAANILPHIPVNPKNGPLWFLQY
jgi:RHS repeat-associated protein